MTIQTRLNRNVFNPNSERCRNGMRFQDRVQAEMANVFAELVNTREEFSKNDPTLTNFELNMLEQRYGDIAVTVNGQRVYVECVSVNTDQASPFPESKIEKFIGDSKWYAIGWDGYGPKFIPARSLNAYMRKCPGFVRDGRGYRKLHRWNVRNIRAGFEGVEAFSRYLRERI